MNQTKAVVLLALICCSLAAFTIPLDTTLIDKHGDKFSEASCNGNTVIDFAFSSGSSLTLGSVAGASSSTLQFLDIQGNELTYTLAGAQLASLAFINGFSKTFLFKFTSGGNTVYVAVPIIDAGATPSSEVQQTVDLSKSQNTAYSSLKSVETGATSLPLSAFNFLNDNINGKFYEIMDKTSSTTLLIARIHFKFTSTLTASAGSLFTAALLSGADSSQSGDVLCWGSQSGTGFFQTHLRESVPLWTFLLATLLFWLFNLLSSEVTPEVYERSFADNKWSCWSLYSIYYLCHEEWFTRTARTSLFLINFCWQGLVAAAVYYHQGLNSVPSILVWVGVIAFAASLPVPYLVGNFFFQRIYGIELEKFRTLREMHHQTNKEKHEELERAAILKEEHIYSIYYFYYSLCIILFALFCTLTVHLMQQFPRDYYHLHFYWLASLGIAFALDHLVCDPVMTAAFGSRAFYRSRGYYYNGQLGELARLAE